VASDGRASNRKAVKKKEGKSKILRGIWEGGKGNGAGLYKTLSLGKGSMMWIFDDYYEYTQER